MPAVTGQQLLLGSIYVPPGEAYTLSRDEQPTGSWPRTVQVLDVPAMANQLDTLLYPYSVRLGSDSAGALTIDWPVINVSPEKHTAYAVQWFAMALVLLLLYLWRSTNAAEVWRSWRDKGGMSA